MTAKPALALCLGLMMSTATLAIASAQSPLPVRPGAAPVAVPPIPFTVRTLKNGLKAYSAVDHSQPTVTVQVWYGVGSKDDPQGRSGFAHLFEHMMFKATRDMPAEYLDRLTEDVGGKNNASTWDDFTNYYEVIPSNHLDRLLWAEAERMSSLKVDQPNFMSERAVVEEELRQSYLANPYGHLELASQDAAYDVHPYKRSTIGSIGDLDAATLPDVKAFHDTYYRPDNASLIVIGDFDQVQLDALVDKDFADIQNPAAPLPRVTVVEPPRTTAKVVDAYAPIVPLPAVRILYHIPSARNPDYIPLQVLDAILSGGKSSRLYDHLVYSQQIAQRVNSDAGRNAQPGLFTLEAIMAGGKTVEQGEAALRAEAAAVRNAPVSEAELARAKTLLIAQLLRERETVLGRGEQLGFAIELEGDAARANADPAALQAVTAADIQRVAAKYLREDASITVRYLPESARPKGVAPAPDLAQFSPKVVADAVPVGIQAPPPPASLATQIPPAGPPRISTPPKIAERTLANGLRVIVARTSDVPLVSAVLSVKNGSSADPMGMAGLQGFTTQLLPQGTATRSAPQIAQAVEDLGGALSPGTGADGSSLSVTVPVDKLSAAPAPSGRRGRAPGLRGRRDRSPAHPTHRRPAGVDDPARLHRPGDGRPRRLRRLALWPDVEPSLLEGDHPLGRHGAIRQDLPAGRRHPGDDRRPGSRGGLHPRRAHLRRLGQTIDAPLHRPDLCVHRQAPRDRGEHPQRRAGGGSRRRAVHRPQRSALLPGGSGQRRPGRRLFRSPERGSAGETGPELRRRLQRGRAAGVGLFTAVAQTKNTSAAEVAALMDAEVSKLGTAPIPETELDARKASLIGERGLSVQESAGMAGVLVEEALYGVDLNQVGRFTADVSAVNAEAARAAAKTVVDPATAAIIVVGDAKVFLPALKAKYPQTEVVEASTLMGGSPPPAIVVRRSR